MAAWLTRKSSHAGTRTDSGALGGCGGARLILASVVAWAGRTGTVTRRNIKGRPFWSRVLSVRLNPSRKDTLYD